MFLPFAMWNSRGVTALPLFLLYPIFQLPQGPSRGSTARQLHHRMHPGPAARVKQRSGHLLYSDSASAHPTMLLVAQKRLFSDILKASALIVGHVLRRRVLPCSYIRQWRLGGAGKEPSRKLTPPPKYPLPPSSFNASTISRSGRFVLLRTVAEMTRSVEQSSIKSCRRQSGGNWGSVLDATATPPVAARFIVASLLSSLI